MVEANGQRIKFVKMTGSGNDFILIDNRSGALDASTSRRLVTMACRRKLSVGADGLILIENDPEVDFRWRFFNADGSEAEMCGNGARCAARFAYLKGIVPSPRMAFRTLAGIIRAEITDGRPRVKMTPPQGLEKDFSLQAEERSFHLDFINTGVPHAVCLVESEAELENMDIARYGRIIRFHPRFQPAGTNANFALVRDAHHMVIRTYERGVESETLACGTGSIASALIAATKGMTASPVELQTRSGETLTVHFERHRQDGPDKEGIRFDEVYLEGEARVVYEAELWDETIQA
jgi:diaminopimelate epimerase